MTPLTRYPQYSNHNRYRDTFKSLNQYAPTPRPSSLPNLYYEPAISYTPSGKKKNQHTTEISASDKQFYGTDFMPIQNFGKNKQKSEIGIKEIADHLAKIRDTKSTTDFMPIKNFAGSIYDRETKSTTGFSDLGYQYSYGDKKLPSNFLYNSLPAVHHTTHLLNNLSKKEFYPLSGNVWTPSTKFDAHIKESNRLNHPGVTAPKGGLVGLNSSTKTK